MLRQRERRELVTIKDIAKAAGVSHTTVSRALKNNPAISPETRARIQTLAQKMGYTPSAVAQSMRAQRTRTVGMVVTTIADPFVVQVVEGVESAAQQAGYSVLLCTSHDEPKREIDVVDTLHRRRVDAIIITSSRVGSLYGERLDRIRVPIVLINNQGEGQYLYSVAVDDRQGAQLAVEHLLALGHRRIGYIGTVRRPRSSQRRLDGYRQALDKAGIRSEAALISPILSADDWQQGQEALAHLLAAKATAVFCYNDLMAIALLTACRQRKLAVPAELSVVGFDDIEPARYITPALTTVNQPRFKLGQLAMRMTLDLLDEQAGQNQLLSCALVVRESTAHLKPEA
ncbi:MAG: LacI family DNA-binding transcriptional regulator [Anaerolineae bacterium]|nr:LacI family DNA-binding transcriptional regulator [Anaerolineae bacterium]